MRLPSPSSLLLSLPLLLLPSLVPSTSAQTPQNLGQNLTSFTGTWSSGSGDVRTGIGFANPANYSFIYPANTGISFSFTDDGYFEEARYRFEANGASPRCIRGIILWQHGNYSINTNGSITMYPIGQDGRIQIQDRCAPTSTIMTYYNQFNLFSQWYQTIDIHKNAYALQLIDINGPLPRLFLVARPPDMLPTRLLTTPQTLQEIAKANGNFVGSSSRLQLPRGSLWRWASDSMSVALGVGVGAVGVGAAGFGLI